MGASRFYVTSITKLIPSLIFSCVQCGCRFPAFLAHFVIRSLSVPLGGFPLHSHCFCYSLPRKSCPMRSLKVFSAPVPCVFTLTNSSPFLARSPRDSLPLSHAVTFCSSLSSLVHYIARFGHCDFFLYSL